MLTSSPVQLVNITNNDDDCDDDDVAAGSAPSSEPEF